MPVYVGSRLEVLVLTGLRLELAAGDCLLARCAGRPQLLFQSVCVLCF